MKTEQLLLLAGGAALLLWFMDKKNAAANPFTTQLPGVTPAQAAAITAGQVAAANLMRPTGPITYAGTNIPVVAPPAIAPAPLPISNRILIDPSTLPDVNTDHPDMFPLHIRQETFGPLPSETETRRGFAGLIYGGWK